MYLYSASTLGLWNILHVSHVEIITVRYFFILLCRHALPLFTSLLNIVCAYDPVGYGVPYNHLMFTDSREQLVEGALQVLCVTMENESSNHNVSVDGTSGGTAMDAQSDVWNILLWK